MTLCASKILAVGRLELWIFATDSRDNQKGVLFQLLHSLLKSDLHSLRYDCTCFTFQPSSPKGSFANPQAVNCQTCEEFGAKIQTDDAFIGDAGQKPPSKSHLYLAARSMTSPMLIQCAQYCKAHGEPAWLGYPWSIDRTQTLCPGRAQHILLSTWQVSTSDIQSEKAHHSIDSTGCVTVCGTNGERFARRKASDSFRPGGET